MLYEVITIAGYWLIIKYLVLLAAIIILISSIDDFFIDCYYWIRRIWRKLTIYKKHKPFNSYNFV